MIYIQDLKNLLFGSTSGSFNEEWKMQGLGFNDINKLEFGIVQHKVIRSHVFTLICVFVTTVAPFRCLSCQEQFGLWKAEK